MLQLIFFVFKKLLSFQDDWDSDFDDESASQIGQQSNGAPANYNTNTENSGNLALPTASYQRGSTGDVTAIGANLNCLNTF